MACLQRFRRAHSVFSPTRYHNKAISRHIVTGEHTLNSPQKKSLYRSDYEHDSCGVGLVANIKGKPLRKIMDDGRIVLERLEHRGAVGEEVNTGDGAGIMTSIPHDFFVKVIKDLDFKLPSEGQYLVGNIFLNPHRAIRLQTKKRFQQIAEDLNLKILGWRKLPTDNSTLGPSALSLEPDIQQVFLVGLDTMALDTRDLQRRGFELIQVSRNQIRGTGSLEDFSYSTTPQPFQQMETTALANKSVRGVDEYFFPCSLSASTITYKGQFTCSQLYDYYEDLCDPHYHSKFAMVHSRFSTNTFPSWERAQPMRYMCHNGEINTVRGNRNWMRAREGIMGSKVISREKLERTYPVVDESGSDSSCLDDVVQFMQHCTDRSLPEIMMMCVPEAWENQTEATMELSKRKFYEWSSFVMEPWDGPALFAFSNGDHVGATLDRNGLRPCRYYITTDDHLIMSSEVGVLDLPAKSVRSKGHIEPGKMLLVDLKYGEFVPDEEIKRTVTSQFPYPEWCTKSITVDDVVANKPPLSVPIPVSREMIGGGDSVTVDPRLSAFGYTQEHLDLILPPMCMTGKEGLGSMGNDAPLACLSKSPKLLFEYFKQHFAQVTNPPIDPFREASVMTLRTPIGPHGNLLTESQDHCRRLVLDLPLLTNNELEAIVTSPPAKKDRLPGAKARENRRRAEKRRNLDSRDLTRSRPNKANPDSNEGWRGRSACIGPTAVVDMTFPKYPKNVGRGVGLEHELRHLLMKVDEEIDAGAAYIVLSDRLVDYDNVPIPSLLAVGAVHQHLVRQRRRLDVGLIVDTAEPREVHHFAALLGFGADAICPYLALDTIHKLVSEGFIQKHGLTLAGATDNYFKAVGMGLRKIMAKMGISTLQGYKGAQIFEAVGLGNDVMSMCFTGTPSRIGGQSFEDIGLASLVRHDYGFPARESTERTVEAPVRQNFGEYHFREGGESHVNTPSAIAYLQSSVRAESCDHEAYLNYQDFSRMQRDAIQSCTIRGALDIVGTVESGIPIESVEPAENIVKRFATGAMSYGSISEEAHETLAIAMNRLGGKSNTGEGGEDPDRYLTIDSSGDSRRSAIKQVASGRFGVTIDYLSNADEIQIKMAQGAKPGEGGELPGHKVSESIAKTRHSTPGVGLISPPPHHDIYSIEDLSQLILDLKSANPSARISVKLVSECGVGTIAAGVAKAHSEHILVSGHDGGTGASSWTGVKHAGLPWELGLAETHQTLVLNNLRSRVTLQTDGQLRTGRDVVIAALLGAEEFGFATAPLIAMGCIMMRKCHLNSCPVGIATQNPELRAKFEGKPEHVVNYFFAVAEEARHYMSTLGFKSIDEMIGRTDVLRPSERARDLKLDFEGLLMPATSLRSDVPVLQSIAQEHNLESRQEHQIAMDLESHLRSTPLQTFERSIQIHNTDRSFGASLSHIISKFMTQNDDLLTPPTVLMKLKGSIGQSFGAFGAKGLQLQLEGDANDYGM